MATAGPSKPLQNIYYERKVATDKPCYICRRPTTTVLATIDTKDFLYTCEGHLSDSYVLPSLPSDVLLNWSAKLTGHRGFATLLNPPAPTPTGPSQEEIRKVIADYKAKEAKKAEKGKEGEKDKDKDKDKAESPKPASAAASPALTSPPAVPAATHRKYALHRQVFDMRQAEIKRKEQGVKAREVGKGLPQVPRGAF